MWGVRDDVSHSSYSAIITINSRLLETLAILSVSGMINVLCTGLLARILWDQWLTTTSTLIYPSHQKCSSDECQLCPSSLFWDRDQETKHFIKTLPWFAVNQFGQPYLAMAVIRGTIHHHYQNINKSTGRQRNHCSALQLPGGVLLTIRKMLTDWQEIPVSFSEILRSWCRMETSYCYCVTVLLWGGQWRSFN